MAFLNKKTWHPGRVQNMEEVWKREQEASKEDQKMKDLQKQIAEERAKEEMMQVAEAAGVKVRSDRLDWMYQGGVGARQEADQRQEAVTTLGGAGAGNSKTAREEQEEGLTGRAGAVAALPSFYSEDTPASANEMWQRLHADPLFAIKQQEVTARRTILSNPVQMQAIKKQVKQLKGGRDGNTDSEEEDRDHDRRHRRDRGGRGGERDRRKEKKRKKERKNRSRSRSRSPSKREKSRRRERDGGPVGREKELERSDSRPREKSRSNRRRRMSRSRSRSPRPSYREDSRDRRNSHRRSRSRSPEDRRRQQRQHDDRRREEGGGRERERTGRDADDRRQHREEYHHDSKSNDDRHLAEEKNKQEEEKGGRPQVHMDGASAQGAGAQYGITYGRHVPDAVRNQDRSHLGEATRKRLEEAAQRKQQENKEAAEQNRHRREQQHRPGKLTEEERQRRLQEMTEAANEHDAQRHARIEEYEKVEAKEAADQQGRDHNDTGRFLQAATKDVYGAGGSGGGINGNGGESLADAVGRRKAFQQRGGDGGGSAFRK